MVRDILLHHVAYANPYRLREPISLTRTHIAYAAAHIGSGWKSHDGWYAAIH
jgi:hypothetical protein